MHPDREWLPRMGQLAAPVALQVALGAAFALLDTLMVAGLGPTAVAGVGLVGRAYMFLGMVIGGLTGAVGLLLTQYLAAGRWRPVGATLSIAVLLGLLVTLPVTLLALFFPEVPASWGTPDAAVASAAAEFLYWSAAYAPLAMLTGLAAAVLRSRANTKVPLQAGLGALVINSAINVLFIEGRFGLPAFGIAAAAAGTVLARCAEFCWMLVAIRLRMRVRIWRWQRRTDWTLLLRQALPLTGKELAWAGGVLASALLVSRMGESALAAFNLILPVEGLLIAAVYGAAVAASIMLGQALGRGQFDAAIDLGQCLLDWVSLRAAAAGVALGAIGLIAYQHTPADASDMPAVWRESLLALSVFCLGFGAKAHNTMVSVGILRCGGDNRWLLVVDLCSMWLLTIPCVAVAALVLHWPLAGVMAIMMVEELVKVPLFRRRVRQGLWLRRF